MEEIRPGGRNLRRSQIMVNLSKMFRVGIQQKYGLSKLKPSLMWNFIIMRLFSTDARVRLLLLVKCNQAFWQNFRSMRAKDLFLSKKY